MALATLLAKDAGQIWSKESPSAFEEASTLAPMFVTRPRDVTCYEGQSAHFDCRIEPMGDGSLSVEWYHDDKPIQVGSRTHTLQDFGFVVLDLDWAFKRDSGVYKCVVTNRCGSAECKARLSCISKKDVSEEVHPIQSTMCMVNMQENMKKYTAEMFLTEEDMYDEEKRQPPRFMSALKSIVHAKEMQPAKFECQLGPVGDPNMKVEWFYNGEPLIAKTQFTPINDFGYIALNLGWVYKQDSGEYLCKATNIFGSDETKATLVCDGKSGINYDSQLPPGMSSLAQIQTMELRVEKPCFDEEETRMKPCFMTKPEAVVVTEGSKARFCCRVIGYPKPRVMWLFNGQTVVNGSRRKLFFDGMWHLEIPKCEEGGKIEVIARNQCGEAYATTSLRVRKRKDDFRGVLKDERISVDELMKRSGYRKPTWLDEVEEIKAKLAAIVQAANIIKEIQTNRIKAGQEAVFVAGFAGNPPPEVSWWFNGNELQESEKIKIETEPSITTLTLTDCDAGMNGTYECRVQNKLASHSTKASLVVAG